MVAKSYVYVYFRPNGVPCYVGKGTGRRWKAHQTRSCNPHLTAIIKAAGGELPVVKIREGLSNAEACETERAFIAAIGRDINGGPLVNMTDGGDGPLGRRMPIEERQRRRDVMSSPEVRAKLSAAHMGKPSGYRGAVVTQETRARLRASHLGKVQSQETKDKRAASLRGQKRSPEWCARQSVIRTGEKRTDEARANMSRVKRARGGGFGR